MTLPLTYSWTLEDDAPSGVSLGVDEEGNAILVDVADVALELAFGGMDAIIRDDDVGFDVGLRTAVILSLFTDRRAEADDNIPSGDGDKRGWWADEFSAVEGDRIGARLWLLDRSAQRTGIAQRLEEYVREGLAWMLEDRVTDRIDVVVEQQPQKLFCAITLGRPDKTPITFRFAHVWAGEATHP